MSLTVAGLLISCLILAWFAHKDFINHDFREGFWNCAFALIPLSALVPMA